MLLPDDIGEGARAQPLGERRGAICAAVALVGRIPAEQIPGHRQDPYSMPTASRRPNGEQIGPKGAPGRLVAFPRRSEEHTSELQSLMRISYAVFCLKKKKT